MSVRYLFRMAEADDSALKRAVKRLEAAAGAAAGFSVPYGTCQVQAADIFTLFEAIKRSGGRWDWTPEEPNIAALPGPVRRYIRRLHAQIGEYQRRLIEIDHYLREIEEGIQTMKHPPR